MNINQSLFLLFLLLLTNNLFPQNSYFSSKETFNYIYKNNKYNVFSVEENYLCDEKKKLMEKILSLSTSDGKDIIFQRNYEYMFESPYAQGKEINKIKKVYVKNHLLFNIKEHITISDYDMKQKHYEVKIKEIYSENGDTLKNIYSKKISFENKIFVIRKIQDFVNGNSQLSYKKIIKNKNKELIFEHITFYDENNFVLFAEEKKIRREKIAPDFWWLKEEIRTLDSNGKEINKVIYVHSSNYKGSEYKNLTLKYEKKNNYLYLTFQKEEKVLRKIKKSKLHLNLEVKEISFHKPYRKSVYSQNIKFYYEKNKEIKEVRKGTLFEREVISENKKNKNWQKFIYLNDTLLYKVVGFQSDKKTKLDLYGSQNNILQKLVIYFYK